MKKLILTAAIAFSIGSLSLLTNSNCKKCSPVSAKSVLLVLNDHNILATAD